MTLVNRLLCRFIRAGVIPPGEEKRVDANILAMLLASKENPNDVEFHWLKIRIRWKFWKVNKEIFI